MADTLRSRWKPWHRVTLVVLLGIAAYVAWYRPSTPQQARPVPAAVADREIPDGRIADLADDGAAVGFWCDTPLDYASNSDNVIAIVTLVDNDLVARSLFRGGDTLEQRLLAEDDRIYAVDDSPHGDRYRVAPGGALLLMDADGVIRTARSLREDADLSHCFR